MFVHNNVIIPLATFLYSLIHQRKRGISNCFVISLLCVVRSVDTLHPLYTPQQSWISLTAQLFLRHALR